MAHRPLTHLLATVEERIKARNELIADLRSRSGLSMDDLAKEMGFAGQSSIQRYLSPSYDKGFRPELAAKFKAALVGRGEPPITPREVAIFDSWPETAQGDTLDLVKMLTDNYDAGQPVETFHKQLDELGIPPRSDIAAILSRARRSSSLGVDEHTRVSGLPLIEGNVVVVMPKRLSAESADTLRSWLEHLVNLATHDQKF